MMRSLSGWMVMLGLILLMGCASSSPPPIYYGLQTVPHQCDTPSRNQLTIGVGPVQLPEYLDRAAIVTRLSPNRLKVNDDRRWAGSLQNEILRVLTTDLKIRTACGRVVAFPWESDVDPDIRIRVTIHAFEGRPGSQVRLQATWSMAQPSVSPAVLLRDCEVVEKVDGEDFESLTAAMGRALAVMSQEMASTATAAQAPVKH